MILVATKGRSVKAFHSNLRTLVEKKYGRLTHDTIAARTGLTRPVVSAWMSDRTFVQLSLGVLEKLADFLDCDIEDLYEIVDVEEEDDPHLMAV